MLPLIPVLLVLILRGSAGASNPSQAQLSAAIQALHRLASSPESEIRARALAAVSAHSSETPETIYSLLCQAAPPVSEPVIGETTPQPVAIEAASGEPKDGFSECRRSRDGPLSR